MYGTFHDRSLHPNLEAGIIVVDAAYLWAGARLVAPAQARIPAPTPAGKSAGSLGSGRPARFGPPMVAAAGAAPDALSAILSACALVYTRAAALRLK